MGLHTAGQGRESPARHKGTCSAVISEPRLARAFGSAEGATPRPRARPRGRRWTRGTGWQGRTWPRVRLTQLTPPFVSEEPRDLGRASPEPPPPRLPHEHRSGGYRTRAREGEGNARKAGSTAPAPPRGRPHRGRPSLPPRATPARGAHGNPRRKPRPSLPQEGVREGSRKQRLSRASKSKSSVVQEKKKKEKKSKFIRKIPQSEAFGRSGERGAR